MSDVVRVVSMPAVQGTYKRVFIEIWQKIVEDLHLTYNITKVNSNYKEGVGSFCNLLDRLENDSADLALQGFTSSVTKLCPPLSSPNTYSLTPPIMTRGLRFAALPKKNDFFDMSILI